MDATLWSRSPLATRPSRYDTGAFATHEIEEGTIVIPEWNEASDGDGWIRLDRAQVQKLPPPARALFRRYGLDTDFDEILGPVDISFVTDPTTSSITPAIRTCATTRRAMSLRRATSAKAGKFSSTTASSS